MAILATSLFLWAISAFFLAFIFLNEKGRKDTWGKRKLSKKTYNRLKPVFYALATICLSPIFYASFSLLAIKDPFAISISVGLVILLPLFFVSSYSLQKSS
jgi:hypothetical protein